MLPDRTCTWGGRCGGGGGGGGGWGLVSLCSEIKTEGNIAAGREVQKLNVNS